MIDACLSCDDNLFIMSYDDLVTQTGNAGSSCSQGSGCNLAPSPDHRHAASGVQAPSNDRPGAGRDPPSMCESEMRLDPVYFELVFGCIRLVLSIIVLHVDGSISPKWRVVPLGLRDASSLDTMI